LLDCLIGFLYNFCTWFNGFDWLSYDNNCLDIRTMPPRRQSLRINNRDPHHGENGDDDLPPPPPPPPPPRFNDRIHQALAQFMADTTRQFTEAIIQASRSNEQVENLGCSICDFSSHNFHSFEGTEGPNVAEAWLTDIEVLFRTLACIDEQRVRYIGLKLTGEAGRWWTAKRVLLGEDAEISSESLKVEYNRRFFPRAQRQLQLIEFQNLVQGNLTVEQYSARFMELARFAVNLIPDEESKAE
jgi:hypothetical protein